MIGRIRRRTFIMTSLLLTFISALLYFNYKIKTEEDLHFLWFICLVIIIISMLISIGRLKDINLSGWLVILLFIPIIQFAYILLFFIDGTVGENKYGSDPKERLKKSISSAHTNDSKTTSSSILEKKLKIVEDSYKEGLLTASEYTSKKDQINKEKQHYNNKLLKKEEYISKKGRLKDLYANGIISKDEYDKKNEVLEKDYRINNYTQAEINLNTIAYYASKGKEHGPHRIYEIIQLVQNKKINPNCFIRFEHEDTYTKRANELLEIK
ncbi:DUF805 domain-containing protein [Joostella sp.]|uniref:DUF805 domain-containing protein n=1 Tax=Joostella sp. TaxID=2231138 RepID=UPI003A8DADEB